MVVRLPMTVDMYTSLRHMYIVGIGTSASFGVRLAR